MFGIKNRKGFTLIELLAVIVILAIVMVVTIPSVLNAMNNAKSSQLQNATDVVSEWLAKQNSYNQLGGGIQEADPAYNNFMAKYGEIPSSLLEAVTNNKNLGNNEWKEEAIVMLETAGVASPEENIDLDNSYIWKGTNNNIDVKLTANPDGSFYVNGGSNSSYSDDSVQGTSVLTSFKIYGNTVDGKGVGDASKNLWNCDLSQKGSNITFESSDNSYIWDYEGTGATLPLCDFAGDPEKIYTLSVYCRGTITPASNGGFVQLYFKYSDDSTVAGGTGAVIGYQALKANEDTRISKTTTKAISKVGFSRRGTGTIYLRNIQIEEGNVATTYQEHYDGYKIPVTITTNGVASTINIYLDQPLRTGEYLDLKEGKVYRSDNTVTSVTIPTLPAMNRSTTVSVGTSVAVAQDHIDFNYIEL